MESPVIGKTPEAGASPAAKAQGIVYTFYSFKGGVGRSMAVANVAALLAKAGHRCLVVDWDLEAPGIERYFEQFPSRLEGSSRETPGLLDMLESLKAGSRLDWRKCLLTAQPFRTGAPIRILTSGRRTPAYSETVQALDWGSLFEEHDLGGYLNELREEWIAEFDFVLVDSRTGINDIGSICTVLLPDVVVLLFTTNRQSLEGVIEIIGAARQARSTLPVDRARLIAVPVPARDESQGAEYERAQEWKRIFASELADLYRDWIPRHLEPRDVLNKLYIPYITIWSFGERLPVVERDEEISDPRSVSAAYSRLATLLAHRLDWGALETGEGYAEVARAREEVARTKDERDRTVRETRLLSLIAATLALIVVAGILSWRMSVSSRRAETQRILTLASAVEDPLIKTLLAAELGEDTEDPGDLLRLREIATAGPVPIAVFQSESWKVTKAALDDQGRRVATACSDGALRVWSSLGTGHPVRIAVEGAPAFRKVAFSDAGFLLALTDLQTALIYRTNSPDARPFEIDNVADAIFPPYSAGRLLVVRTPGFIESFWLERGLAKEHSMGNSSLLGIGREQIFFNVDGSALCLLSRERAEVWRTAKESRDLGFYDSVDLKLYRGVATTAALDPKSTLLAVGFEDGRIAFWGLGNPPSRFGEERIHKGSVDHIVFSPDGTEILSTSSGQARLWSWTSRPTDFGVDFPIEGGQITEAVFSPNGRRILVASQEGTAFVWFRDDIGSRQALRGHEGGVTSAEFSRDGSQVLTVSGSGTARVWKLQEKSPPVPATWQGLRDFLHDRTSACLTPSQRAQYLSESQTDAQEAFADCERRNGRSPDPGS